MGRDTHPYHSQNNHNPDVKCISLLCFVTVHAHEPSGHALLGLASFSQQYICGSRAYCYMYLTFIHFQNLKILHSAV